jgi:hypothetical protein
MISVSSSVSAPSVTSHTLSAMPEASSKMTRMRLPLLCRPANASVLFSLHVTASMRHVFSCPGSAEWSAVAVQTKSSLVDGEPVPLRQLGPRLLRSWVSVFAVTTPRASSCVASAQRVSHATSADLPMPWPDETASESPRPSPCPSRRARRSR